jgi:ABC-type bacteriocin/lantibiotic exporter with double-glycine peptidase domain
MHVPHHKQERDYSCLPACVKMVLAYHGLEKNEAELRILLKTRPGGTSPVQVIWRLPELGFDASVELGSESALHNYLHSNVPCIVHVWTPPLPYWDSEAIHALVVTAIDDRNVLVNDPVLADGSKEVPLDAFLEAWAATDHFMIIITKSGE